MQDFGPLVNFFKTYDKQREKLIKKSRDVLKSSKRLIYSLHRNDLKLAKKILKQIESEKKDLDKIVRSDVKLSFEGSYKVAISEYVEAVLYYHFVDSGNLQVLNVHPEYYIFGLCDLTGELVRRAVYLAGKNQVNLVCVIRDLVDNLYGSMLEFDFRESELRRKVDSMKYDLRKLEDLVLDLHLREKFTSS